MKKKTKTTKKRSNVIFSVEEFTGSCEVELKSAERFRMERGKKKHIAILVVNLPTAP